jgi:hypothetical protein
MTWVAIHRQLDTLAYLPDGWDGDNARAPDDELVTGVRELLAMLQRSDAPAPSRILPIQDGGVLIEWTTPDRYLEIEIEEPYCGEFMEIREGAQTEHYRFCWRKARAEDDDELQLWANSTSYFPSASSSRGVMQM